MTASIKGLHQRLDKLEGLPCDRDYEQEALDGLSIEDLDALEEVVALYQSGYSEVEIANMMGERWPQVKIAIKRYQEKLADLMQLGSE
jgi:hypothetical protein